MGCAGGKIRSEIFRLLPKKLVDKYLKYSNGIGALPRQFEKDFPKETNKYDIINLNTRDDLFARRPNTSPICNSIRPSKARDAKENQVSDPGWCIVVNGLIASAACGATGLPVGHIDGVNLTQDSESINFAFVLKLSNNDALARAFNDHQISRLPESGRKT